LPHFGTNTHAPTRHERDMVASRCVCEGISANGQYQVGRSDRRGKLCGRTVSGAGNHHRDQCVPRRGGSYRCRGNADLLSNGQTRRPSECQRECSKFCLTRSASISRSSSNGSAGVSSADAAAADPLELLRSPQDSQSPHRKQVNDSAREQGRLPLGRPSPWLTLFPNERERGAPSPVVDGARHAP
jgi:hypothetical protein